MVEAWSRVTDSAYTFIIAEAGVNHNGSLERARRMVDAAVKAKADAIKFQTFKASHLVSAQAPKAEYQQSSGEQGESQLDMLRRLELREEGHRALFDYCQEKNIMFLSTAFDKESVDFLDALGVEIFKVPSGELRNRILLEHIARKNKPVILSTGMEMLGQIEEAVDIFRQADTEFVLLYCVSCYPAGEGQIDLKVIETLKEKFSVPVGFSDHTVGIKVALASVLKEACVIEKHFTIPDDGTASSPDHDFSLRPGELEELVAGIREAEKMRTGVTSTAYDKTGEKVISAGEKKIADVVRKSLVAARDINRGETLCEKMIAVKRPGTGLSPKDIFGVINKKARVMIPKDTLILQEMVE